MGLKQWGDKEATGGFWGSLHLVCGVICAWVWGAFGVVFLRRRLLLIPVWMGDKFDKIFCGVG